MIEPLPVKATKQFALHGPFSTYLSEGVDGGVSEGGSEGGSEGVDEGVSE